MGPNFPRTMPVAKRGGARAQYPPPLFATAMVRRKFGPIRAIFSTVGPLFFQNFPLRGWRLGPFRRTACGGANGAKIFENPITTFLGCHQKKAYFPTLHCQFSRFYFLACFFSYLFSEFHSKTLARGFFKKAFARGHLCRSSVSLAFRSKVSSSIAKIGFKLVKTKYF